LEEINALPDLQCPTVVLSQEIMKEKIIERTTDLQKVSVDFVVA
jgi:hypothetical protein